MQTIVFVVALVGALYPDGVRLPAEGFGNSASLITPGGVQQLAGGPQQEFADFVGTQLPPSDRAKWYLTVYVDRLNDPESQLLLRDFDANPALAKLKSWCKFQMVDKLAAPSQEARMLANEIGSQGKPIPTVLLYANPDDPTFGRGAAGGWRYVYQGSGYGGDAEAMARNIYESIRAEYKRRGVQQCPGPYCPQPNPQPNLPEPSPYQPQPVDPYRPHTEPHNPWPVQPMPKMDQPIPGEDSPLSTRLLREEYVLLAVVLAVVGFVAWRRGWLDRPAPLQTPVQASAPNPPAKAPAPKPPAGPAAALLIAALLGCATLAGCRSEPCCAAGPDKDQGPVVEQFAEEHAPIGPIGRFWIDAPAVAPDVVTTDWPPCELALFDRITARVDGVIRAVKLFVCLVVGLSVANLIASLRILQVLKRGKT